MAVDIGLRQNLSLYIWAVYAKTAFQDLINRPIFRHFKRELSPSHSAHSKLAQTFSTYISPCTFHFVDVPQDHNPFFLYIRQTIHWFILMGWLWLKWHVIFLHLLETLSMILRKSCVSTFTLHQFLNEHNSTSWKWAMTTFRFFLAKAWKNRTNQRQP